MSNTPTKHKYGFKAWQPTIGLALATFIFNTSEFLPVGLLPDIAESMGDTVAETGLIITGYAWVVALLSLPMTVVTAKIERRKLLLWLVGIFAASHFIVLWANTFEKLFAARLCVALVHSIFWSIMTPLAARMAPFGKQALGLAAVMGGCIVATVLGIPIGTKLGHWFGWQEAFFVVGVAASLIWLLIYAVLPEAPSNRAGSLKSLPVILKRPALIQLYLLTAITILGQFTAYSYISPILMNIGGVSPDNVVDILFVFGIAGIIGTVISAKTVDKHTSATLLVPLVLLTACLAGFGPISSNWPALIALTVVWGASMTAMAMAFQTILLKVGHDAADIATSLYSGIFNIGIGGGAAVGSFVAATYGFAPINFVAAALTGISMLICFAVLLKTGCAVIPFNDTESK